MQEKITNEPYQFIPDQELIDFAIDFSQKYKIISAGDDEEHPFCYLSNNKKYQIQYIENREHDASVGTESGIIRLGKKLLSKKGITSDYVFYIIIWCVIKFNGNKWIEDNMEVDMIALDYYLTTKRSKKNLSAGIATCFKIPIKSQIDRLLLVNKKLTNK